MEPADMYGKVMSMSDANIGNYLRMCTRIPLGEVAEMEHEAGTGNPRDVKMKLAREITCMYHGEERAQSAEESFIETFQNKEVPEDVLEIHPDYALDMVSKGVVASKTELRRLFAGGGVRNAETGEKYIDFPAGITHEKPITLKIGKRRFVKLLP
jgi:tyrosyl-tRNA synthetase